MEIKRAHYLNKLIMKKHNGLITVVTEIRRCRKSYILFPLFRNHLLESGVDESHIIKLAFDSFENKKYRDHEVMYQFIKAQLADDKMHYVLLDPDSLDK